MEFPDNIANTKEIDLNKHKLSKSFPEEGIYIGDLKSLTGDSFPALFYLSQVNGLGFLTTKGNRDKMHKAMQNIALRILLETPCGLTKLKMFDPTGMGDNLIFLAQLSEKIKGENILIDEFQLKRMLDDLGNEIPSIIQKVLGHKYRDKTLIEYNKDARELAKPYNLLMIADYPQSFTNDLNNKLFKILQTGKRAGIFSFISINTDFEPINHIDISGTDILTKISCIYEIENRFYIQGVPSQDYFNNWFKFKLNTEIPENLDEIIDFINSQTETIKKVEVSLADKLTEKNIWIKDASYGIETPIGKVNATDVKNFKLSFENGEMDTPHHCLIGGATGSGKTVLLHNIICNTAWFYSPEEVQLLLLDYKEGTEFKVYKDLPHVKVLSIRSEREFGVSVMEYLNKEIANRAELFKKEDVSKIENYNKKREIDRLPRIIIVIDEFQKLLEGSDKTTSFITKCLDDIGRRGRSFGINLILSTQSINGVNISQTLSHLGLRIVLKLITTKDCDQLLGIGNHVPLSFTKKGEAIYNTRGGVSEGNNRFQIAYNSTEGATSIINKLKQKAKDVYKDNTFKQFIYDGKLKPNISDNPDYNKIPKNNNVAKIFIGEPIKLIETHLFFKLRKQNESNVIVVGQDIESAISIFIHTFIQIRKQSTEECELYLFNKLNIDNELFPWLEKLCDINNIKHINTNKEIEAIITNNHDELIQRINGKDSTNRIVLGFFDIFNIRELRKQGITPNEINKKFIQLLIDGPEYNIFCIVYSINYQSLGNIINILQDKHNFETKIALKGGESQKILDLGQNEEINSFGLAIINSPYTNGNEKTKNLQYLKLILCLNTTSNLNLLKHKQNDIEELYKKKD